MIDILTPLNAGIVLIVALLSLGVAYRAVLTSRTPQGATAWILLILLLPVIGTLLYLVFGHANFRRFERDRKRSDDQLFELDPGEDGYKPGSRLNAFSRLARLPVVGGNDMKLLIDARATYDAMNDAIGGASSHVFVQFYTIEDDEVGRALRELLIERARAGVSVWVLHDALPFFGLPTRFKRPMLEAGVRVARTKGPTRLLGRFQLNYRNHRKLVIVDNETAFTGGINISTDYLGMNPSIGPWRDTFAAFRGPVVEQLARHFSSDWKWANGDDLSRIASRAPEPAGDLDAVALAPSPAEHVAAGNMYFIALAHAAQKRLWIATPYFVPDRDVLTALRFAAIRGVEVKLLVPEKTDSFLTHYAAMAYFDDLRSVGAEVWAYKAGFLHQKVILVDDDLSSIGSVNLDIRSGLLNFEIAVVVDGKSAARDVREMLEADFGKAEMIDFNLAERSFFTRAAARITRLMAPVL
ncbi:cardiolipin synthase [Marivita sp. GX14005]|uniref:cardiolipin synthase n=1 Tax=Marivita sp. GX14005 TaxID=2942276 RepID=UPI002018F3E0|nr:cardiolipin synthase [Marivita sp. GX14005]MCL3881068.1 cardiolipin synthase [Marivita sp. GX14005]